MYRGQRRALYFAKVAASGAASARRKQRANVEGE